MDVEKTMEFILQQQAKAEANAERQMTAIRKLIQTGMRMIVKNEESIKELAAAQKVTEAKLQDLAAAQKVTEIKLKGLIDAWRRGGNGRHAKN
jgi:DNA-binding Xre family transcriptional regulator